jgi:surface protein
MYAMFRDAALFNQPIGNWNTSNVKTMHGMFQRNRAFNQPIGSWATVGVTDTAYMFEDATAFNHDITGWASNTMGDFSVNMFEGALAWNAIFSRGDSSTNGPARDWTLVSQYCGDNERVETGACVACPSGDDKTGVDTTCGECAEDHYVAAGACVACAAGYVNARRDRVDGGDTGCHTTCDPRISCVIAGPAMKSTGCAGVTIPHGSTCTPTCDPGYAVDSMSVCDINATTCEPTLRAGKCSAPCRDFLCLSAPSAPAARAKVAELRLRREEL